MFDGAGALASWPPRPHGLIRRSVPSTIIRSFNYHPEARELEVWFTTGRCYIYSGVPPEAAEAFRSAFSKGRHFNARIRGRYPYREWTGD